jgi:hypothetical protein
MMGLWEPFEVALFLVTLSGCTATGTSPSLAESSSPSQPSPSSSVAAPSVPPAGEEAIQFVLNDTYTLGIPRASASRTLVIDPTDTSCSTRRADCTTSTARAGDSSFRPGRIAT